MFASSLQAEKHKKTIRGYFLRDMANKATKANKKATAVTNDVTCAMELANVFIKRNPLSQDTMQCIASIQRSILSVREIVDEIYLIQENITSEISQLSSSSSSF